MITTDGQENSSRRYDYGTVKHQITRQQEKYGWEFLFLGANMDAVGEAGRLGIRAERAVRYRCDGRGTYLNYSSVSEAVRNIRRREVLTEEWKADIEEYANR